MTTPTSAGSSRSLPTSWSVCLLQRVAGPRPPRSSTISLKPLATPRPGIGGAPKIVDLAVLDLPGILVPQAEP